jgi:hypothetical protein
MLSVGWHVLLVIIFPVYGMPGKKVYIKTWLKKNIKNRKKKL